MDVAICGTVSPGSVLQYIESSCRQYLPINMRAPKKTRSSGAVRGLWAKPSARMVPFLSGGGVLMLDLLRRSASGLSSGPVGGRSIHLPFSLTLITSSFPF
eukprot:6863783-Prymnesium_polylepis.1